MGQETARPRPAEIYRVHGDKSTVRGVAQVTGTWLAIIAVVLVAAHIETWWAAVVAIVLLVGLQHRFFTIYHESIHACLTRNEAVGHFIGKYFAAYPSLSRYEGVRRRHLDHHLYAASVKDPERVSHCANWRELLPLMFPIPWALTRAVFGRAPFTKEFERVLANRDNSPYPFTPGERQAIVLTAVAIIVILALVCWGTGANPLWALLYPVTLVLFTAPFMTLRQWVEHFNGDRHTDDARYFYIRSNPLERFLFAPMHFNYHGVHHYYPGVPHYNLPRVQRQLADAGLPVPERRTYMGLIARIPW